MLIWIGNRLMNVIELFEEVIKRIDEGRVVDDVDMGFNKAFDKLPWKSG